MQRTKFLSSTLAGTVPHPPPPRGSEKQEEWEDQEQEDTRRTCTTQGNDIYPDREPHCRGRRCALPPRPPPAFILKPCPCCFDNQTKQAEPHSPNHDKIMLNFAMLQRHNGTVLRCVNRCFQCWCYPLLLLLLLRCYCTATALLLHCYCMSTALLLH